MDKSVADALAAQIQFLSSEIEHLKHFICESEDLRERYKTFLKQPMSRHGSFSSACICAQSSDRVGVIFNEARFYAFDQETNPDRYDSKPDGGQLYKQDKFKEQVKKEVAPLFEKLAALEPERLRKEHITWLHRCDNRFVLWRYLTWLIPEIQSDQFGFRKPIAHPEALAAIEKLSEIINGKGPANVP